MVDTGQQVGTLGRQPCQRFVPAKQAGCGGGDWHCHSGGRPRVAGQVLVGSLGSVLVVIEQPSDGLLTVTGGLLGSCEAAGVFADPIMHPVPAVNRPGEQAVAVQSNASRWLTGWVR
jgi:hypothetical protein